MAYVVGHLSVASLEERYEACEDVTSSRHFQAIWLLAKGHSTGEVAAMDLAPRTQHEKTAGQNPRPRSTPWPNNVSFTIPAETESLPTPAAQDFIYYPRRSAAAFAASATRRGARQNLVATSRLSPKPGLSRIPGVPKDAGGGAARTRPIGHQFTVTKPTASVLDVLRLGLR